jgi:hypothetical protein
MPEGTPLLLQLLVAQRPEGEVHTCGAGFSPDVYEPIIHDHLEHIHIFILTYFFVG